MSIPIPSPKSQQLLKLFDIETSNLQFFKGFVKTIGNMFNFENISTVKIHVCVTFFFKPYIQLAYKTAQNLFQTVYSYMITLHWSSDEQLT